jgi:hypothetical protein
MTFAHLLAAAVVASASPAVAGEINHQARVGAALRDGCAVQHVHTPAGKLVHSAPIVRCDRATQAAARRGGSDVRLASASASGRSR